MLRGEFRKGVLRTDGRIGLGHQLILFDDSDVADEAMRRLEGWDDLVDERETLKAKVKRLEVFEDVCMKLLTGELKADVVRETLVELWTVAADPSMAAIAAQWSELNLPVESETETETP